MPTYSKGANVFYSNHASKTDRNDWLILSRELTFKSGDKMKFKKISEQCFINAAGLDSKLPQVISFISLQNGICSLYKSRIQRPCFHFFLVEPKRGRCKRNPAGHILQRSAYGPIALNIWRDC